MRRIKYYTSLNTFSFVESAKSQCITVPNLMYNRGTKVQHHYSTVANYVSFLNSIHIHINNTIVRNPGFVAGHLINVEFGGLGNDDNLTPLTLSANANHSTIEQFVKNQKIYIDSNINLQNNKYHCKIEYAVTVSNETITSGDKLDPLISVFNYISVYIRFEMVNNPFIPATQRQINLMKDNSQEIFSYLNNIPNPSGNINNSVVTNYQKDFKYNVYNVI